MPLLYLSIYFFVIQVQLCDLTPIHLPLLKLNSLTLEQEKMSNKYDYMYTKHWNNYILLERFNRYSQLIKWIDFSSKSLQSHLKQYPKQKQAPSYWMELPKQFMLNRVNDGREVAGDYIGWRPNGKICSIELITCIEPTTAYTYQAQGGHSRAMPEREMDSSTLSYCF